MYNDKEHCTLLNTEEQLIYSRLCAEDQEILADFIDIINSRHIPYNQAVRIVTMALIAVFESGRSEGLFFGPELETLQHNLGALCSSVYYVAIQKEINNRG